MQNKFITNVFKFDICPTKFIYITRLRLLDGAKFFRYDFNRNPSSL